MAIGMFPEAETAAKLAIQKGGNPDASQASMVLGRALTAQGKYDEAVVAFGQVKAGTVTPRSARLWHTAVGEARPERSGSPGIGMGNRIGVVSRRLPPVPTAAPRSQAAASRRFP